MCVCCRFQVPIITQMKPLLTIITLGIILDGKYSDCQIMKISNASADGFIVS